MSSIILIETATKTCSLALSVEGEILFNRFDESGMSHAKNLGLFAAEAVELARKQGITIDAVAVSAGPGSYTGLRIGVSEAKGLCFGLDVPLIAVPTLEVLTNSLLSTKQIDGDCLFCPMIDARRMEVYAALYDQSLCEIRPVQADIVDETTYAPYLRNQKLVFFGDGASKCKAVIDSPNAIFVDNIHPIASAMNTLATNAFAERNFVDVAYFEPYYLKEFQTSVAKQSLGS